MPWTSKSKDIPITNTKDHPAKSSGLVSRAPGVSPILFTPAEFFGAAGRCCHLHVINPALVTPKSAIVKTLVEQHVDDTNSSFAVEASADNFKDYVETYFTGTVAAGIAYLAMIKDGYTWSDHFENIGGATRRRQNRRILFLRVLDTATRRWSSPKARAAPPSVSTRRSVRATPIRSNLILAMRWGPQPRLMAIASAPIFPRPPKGCSTSTTPARSRRRLPARLQAVPDQMRPSSATITRPFSGSRTAKPCRVKFATGVLRIASLNSFISSGSARDG